MSLYYDALSILENKSGQGGTLKSRIYNNKTTNNGDDKRTGIRSPPAQIYALITETRKWSSILAEVIDRSEILKLERKLTPQLSLLLVHDLLLSKKAADDTSGKNSSVNGIAASAHHPLRLTIEKHKARLRAEFTKLRIKKGYASVKELRAAVDAGVDHSATGGDDVKGHSGDGFVKSIDSINILGPRKIEKSRLSFRREAHPRWVRINALKSTLEEQLRTTFAAYTRVDTLEKLVTAPPAAQVLKVDELVPDLLALPPNHELSSNEAYAHGKLIIQDKASCFPALLLLSKESRSGGDIIDACAAPGNKTTHLAALLQNARQQRLMIKQEQQPRDDKMRLNSEPRAKKPQKIFAFERDPKRTITLRKMVSWAGAGQHVSIKGGTDFLKVDPKDKNFARVKVILLDPSCSGSGIVGRDDDEEQKMKMVLPGSVKGLNGSASSQSLQRLRNHSQHIRKKRKIDCVKSKDNNSTIITDVEVTNEDQTEDFTDPSNQQRLRSLSAFQLSLLRHAMRFPSADRIVYSTCSIHWEENEDVVRRALQLYECQNGRWEVQRRDDGQGVLKCWKGRGLKMRENSCKKNGGLDGGLNGTVCDGNSEDDSRIDDAIADACIRCTKDDGQGTMGFFVVAFVRGGAEHEGQIKPRQEDEDSDNEDSDLSRDEEEEWEGFGDT